MPRHSPSTPGLIQDVGIAALVGAVVAWSPITTAHRLIPSLVGGFAAAIALFAYRRQARRFPLESSRPSRPEIDSLRSSGDARFDRTSDGPPPALIWTCVGLALAISIPTWRGLLPWYLESVWQNGHGLLLPLAIAAIWRSIRNREGLPADRPSLFGVPILAIGLGLVVLDFGIRTLHMAILGWILVASGSTLAMLGPRTLRTYAPAIGMLIFFLPLPTEVGAPLGLPVVGAALAAVSLSAIGLPINWEANTLILPSEMYEVSLRCSGFAALYSGAALAVAFGAASGRWRRVVLILALLWPLTIIANGFRMFVLILYCQWRNVLVNSTSVHGFSGILAFVIVIAGVMLLATPASRRALLAPS